jgi:hypothetical protein
VIWGDICPTLYSHYEEHGNESDFMTPKQGNGKTDHHRQWVSIIPYGIHAQHPNAYKDILDTIWENRGNLGYAYRILRDGCCDGCALGTSGMHDWTMEGIHLCAVRLQLPRLNTVPAITVIANVMRVSLVLPIIARRPSRAQPGVPAVAAAAD